MSEHDDFAEESETETESIFQEFQNMRAAAVTVAMPAMDTVEAQDGANTQMLDESDEELVGVLPAAEAVTPLGSPFSSMSPSACEEGGHTNQCENKPNKQKIILLLRLKKI